MFTDSNEHVKLAAFQELQGALKIKRINDELLEFLTSSLRWLMHYSQKNNLPLPEKDRIVDILDRVMAIADKLPTRNQHDFKHEDDSTEPGFILFEEIVYKNYTYVQNILL
jgi:hypothetical protein